MARLLNIVAILFAGFAVVQGCVHCQCLYQDGSHCCVQELPSGADADCQALCKDAKQAGPNQFQPGPACNAGGKSDCVSTWNAHFRTKCYGYPN
ncbi:hypothetical protein FBEOM_10956 [Fusarium beomiforme]|uniref:Uncharacterized protein n=1 Tax=Fusarium beomiforme TaxID=44412 RepID=A0A9P5AC36_9HYPO|nr:hypothetical protein FBEOM_10956 [Fusarium beomiforme]